MKTGPEPYRDAVAKVRILGPVQLLGPEGEVHQLPSSTQRRLLGILALSAGSTMRPAQLSEHLGVTDAALRTTIARLRSRIGANLLRTDASGYRITCGVDASEFTAIVDDRSRGTDELARLDVALGLWAGEVLDEFRHEAWAEGACYQLDEQRAMTIDRRTELLIAAGRGAEATIAIQVQIVRHPLRDRSRGLLMRALAVEGRQADALRAYQSYRCFLAEEIGVDPSADVVAIERRIANGWTGRDEPGRAPLAFTRPISSSPPPLAAPRVPVDAILRDHAPLIGRRGQLSALLTDVANTGAGALRTVVLSGEAGIGKTTLLGAFALAVHDDGGTVLYGRCDEGAAVPLQPLRDVVSNLVDHAPMGAIIANNERFDGVLTRIAPQVTTRFPWASSTTPTAPVDDATDRHRLFESIADLVRRVANNVHQGTGKRLVIILDDLHWVEPTALLLLRHCVRTLVDVPVLFVVSFRDVGERTPDELRSALADLARGHNRRIPLLGFDAAELGDLAMSVTGGVLGVPSLGLVHHLREETAGNPLYASHLVRHLVESGRIVPTDDLAEFSVQGGGQPNESEIPPSLRDVVWSRVRAVGDQAPVVLSTAAVLGVEFGEDLVVELLDASEADVAFILDAAIEAGLLVEVGSVTRRLRFTHALVAHALAGEVRGLRRQMLHERIAQTLQTHAEARSGEPPQRLVVELATHWARAGRPAEARHWATRAGDFAFDHFAPAEAARWYEQALEHGVALDESEADRAPRLLRLGDARRRCGDPRSHATLLEAAAMAQRTNNNQVLMGAALADDRGSPAAGSVDTGCLGVIEAALAVSDMSDPTSHARLLALFARELIHTGRADERENAARRALAIADASDDPTLIARIAPPLLFALWDPAWFDVRVSLGVRAAAAADRTDDVFLQFRAHLAAFLVAIECADAAWADRARTRVMALADQIGEPRLRWNAMIIQTFEATMGARMAEADALAAQAFALSTELGDDGAFTIYAAEIFVLMTFAGRHDELFPLVHQALQQSPYVIGFRLAYAIISTFVGRSDEARAILDSGAANGFANVPNDYLWKTTIIGYAIIAIELHDERAAALLFPILEPFAREVSFNSATSQGPIAAYLGKLASLLGHHDEADAHLHSALSIATSFGWRYHRATTLVSLALSRRRRLGALDDEAAAWLNEASTICAECGLRSVATQIERMWSGPA